ncbi:unnamed protein product [Sphenostylis stenocarpa]|uniref:Protein NUCLEAR FUSION DEFECTIVE 6, chloroplastic/mitochondrial n=1 Tax=Sphenostylis stenocarpa TaxID=92480 RepID=A0AA86VLF6_9FABA|nr:unnamed protein product [Sphenostylis stenocarpa]
MASTAGAAARSILRSCSGRRTAFRLGSEAKAARSPFRVASNKPLSQSTLRCPVELSFCVESMLPYHTATASALMTSMLSVSRHSYGWLPEGIVSASSALQSIILESKAKRRLFEDQEASLISHPALKGQLIVEAYTDLFCLIRLQ